MVITLTKNDDALYLRHEGKANPQVVHLTLDLEAGTLGAVVRDERDLAQNARAFHGIDRTWAIPPLRVAALATLIMRVRSHAAILLAHSTIVRNGSDYVGRLDKEALEAESAIGAIIDEGAWSWDETDVWAPWRATVHFENLSSAEVLEAIGLSGSSTPEEVAVAASKELAGAGVPLELNDVVEYLGNLVGEVEVTT